jgi:hypothetical protein
MVAKRPMLAVLSVRRFFAIGVVALALALGCEDPPIEVPPDKGGPGETLGGGESGTETGDGDGDGDGFSFASPVTTEVFAFDDLQLADLDADGCADLVLAGTGAPPRVNVYPSSCDGSFAAPPITHELNDHDGFVLGDLDADGRADFFIRASGEPPRVEARRTSDDFGLGGPIVSEVYTYDRLWAIDLDGDGRSEALTSLADATPTAINSWTGPGDGTLTLLATAEVGSFDTAAVAQLDDDPFGDLITGLGEVPVINPWLGQGDGSLTSAALFWPFTFTTIALGDLDGDGRPELLTDIPNNDWRVLIYANTGDGFSPIPAELSGVSYTRLRSGDIDGDGDDDLVLTPTGQPPRIMVWRSIGF